MKIKIGDYFKVINDGFNEKYNGNIGIVIEICINDGFHPYRGKLLTKIHLCEKEKYPFHRKEVRIISVGEAIFEVL